MAYSKQGEGSGDIVFEQYWVEIGEDDIITASLDKKTNVWDNDRVSKSYIVEWETDLDENEFISLIDSQPYEDGRRNEVDYPCNDGQNRGIEFSPSVTKKNRDDFTDYEIAWTLFDDGFKIISVESYGESMEPVERFFEKTSSEHDQDTEEFIDNFGKLLENEW